MEFAIFIAAVVFAVAGAAAGFWFGRRRPEPPQELVNAIGRIESQIREVERNQHHALGGLDHHLSALGKETTALSQALRVPNARGRWGELTLRRVAELSGMANYCDFYEQASSGGSRPDMIVQLPGGRVIAVDAKAPLSGYLDAEGAATEAERNAALDRHAQQLARHAAGLSQREYWAQLQPAPDLVVLFLPGDHFLSAALARDPELLEKAAAKRVILATPVTLISVLKGVAYSWRQERLATNTEELRRLASELYDRARAFAENYAETGRSLSKALEAYNRSVGSWDTRLDPSLRRMRDLGVGGSTEVPALPKPDATVRQPKDIVQ